MSDTSLHIALTFDDNFWAPAYATMRSICLSSRRARDIVFHLVHWHLSAAHRRELDAIVTEFGPTLIDHRLEDDSDLAAHLAPLPHAKGLPPIVYVRLFLEHYVPPEAKRFLFIDCDVYVRAPIENLIGIDLGGKAIAAAPEPGRQRLLMGVDMRPNGKPFASYDGYFNAGILVIDRDRWVAARLPAQLDDHISTGMIHKIYQDQDILNLAFRDDWLELGTRWNLTKPHPALRSLDPYIVHYTTGMKPWNTIAYVAFGSSYRHVMTHDVFSRYRRERWGRRFKTLLGR
ncbi:MAG TPA: glycosyltransferase family 8 protein [Devosiaceae bacterium]